MGEKALKHSSDLQALVIIIETLVLFFPCRAKTTGNLKLGIEKIEYLVDIVPGQLQLMPPGAVEIWYLYDEASYRWTPSVARTSNLNYIFKNNEWKTR